MQRLKAVLFDLDGTLIDSEYFHYSCWMDILGTFDINVSYEEWAMTYAGHPLPENCKKIKETFRLDIPLQELMDWRERLSREGFSTKDIRLMPYAAETLEYFKSKGLKIALVTASPRDNVKIIFERNGLGHYFDAMVTRSDVELSKPDPESYLKAVEQLGVEKDACLAFEDTLNGLSAAKGADVACYAIQHDVSQHALLSIADKIFLSLDEAIKDLEAQALV
jgi:HAD superfamily hydrolase (TIGR01509 family)